MQLRDDFVYRESDKEQKTFFFGEKLDAKNRWINLAERMVCDLIEEYYLQSIPQETVEVQYLQESHLEWLVCDSLKNDKNTVRSIHDRRFDTHLPATKLKRAREFYMVLNSFFEKSVWIRNDCLFGQYGARTLPPEYNGEPGKQLQ